MTLFFSVSAVAVDLAAPAVDLVAEAGVAVVALAEVHPLTAPTEPRAPKKPKVWWVWPLPQGASAFLHIPFILLNGALLLLMSLSL